MLPPIPVGDNVLDLVVIGWGPAGLALAAESAKLGVKVGLIGPDLPFTNNYGVGRMSRKTRFMLAGIVILSIYIFIRCVESGVSYLDSRVESIVEASNGISLVACGHIIVVSCRLATVASGAASGKLLQYEVGGPKVAVQTAYGIEVEEWSWIPVGGSLPNTEQKNLAFGAAACMDVAGFPWLYIVLG
ncbi:hypothetical protein C1H46_009640 [Malus baccata]|uniref:FAD/NAD(P)-binding domain-containing protein n=1 Tax=Malus baccata TaxID=106549 RepID=A0A540N142_MALBA|nr:hypothetical protein C1H46_009640 [Malus baccata]